MAEPHRVFADIELRVIATMLSDFGKAIGLLKENNFIERITRGGGQISAEENDIFKRLWQRVPERERDRWRKWCARQEEQAKKRVKIEELKRSRCERLPDWKEICEHREWYLQTGEWCDNMMFYKTWEMLKGPEQDQSAESELEQEEWVTKGASKGKGSWANAPRLC